MKSEMERAKAQFEYEREQHAHIMALPKGAKRSQAFSEAYAGLAEGQRRGDFLDQETEPQNKLTRSFAF